LAVVRVRFDLPDAVSPARLGISTDWRFLALFLSDVGIHAAGQCADMASHLRDEAARGARNLLGEHDFSDEKLRDSVGIPPPKNRPEIVSSNGGAKTRINS
jgi:hypothetical protein